MAKAKKTRTALKRYAKNGGKRRHHTRKRKGGYWFYPGPGDEENSWSKTLSNPFKKNETSNAPVVVEESNSFKEDFTPTNLPPSKDNGSPEVVEETTEVVEEKEDANLPFASAEGMSGGRSRHRRKRLRKSRKKTKKQKGGRRRKSKKRASKRCK